MACEWMRMPNGRMAIVCGPRGPRRRVKCSVRGCTAPGDYQCDAPLLVGTCDRYVCDRHRTPVRRGVDHCPGHA